MQSPEQNDICIQMLERKGKMRTGAPIMLEWNMETWSGTPTKMDRTLVTARLQINGRPFTAATAHLALART